MARSTFKSVIGALNAGFLVVKIFRGYLLLLLIFFGVLSMAIAGIVAGAGSDDDVSRFFAAISLLSLGSIASLFLILQGLGLKSRYWPPIKKQCQSLLSFICGALQKCFRHHDPYSDCKAPFKVALDDFDFHVGCPTIRRALTDAIVDHSLDDAAGESLALELCWAHARNRKSPISSLRVDAELREAWLWHRCSQAMRRGGHHYSQARSVVEDILNRIREISDPGPATIYRLQAFAEATADPELRRRVIYTLLIIFSRRERYGISIRSSASLLKWDLRRKFG